MQNPKNPTKLPVPRDKGANADKQRIAKALAAAKSRLPKPMSKGVVPSPPGPAPMNRTPIEQNKKGPWVAAS